jgi:hypothetical protein
MWSSVENLAVFCFARPAMNFAPHSIPFWADSSITDRREQHGDYRKQGL